MPFGSITKAMTMMRVYPVSLVCLGVAIACQPSSSQLTESHRSAIEDSVRQFLTEFADQTSTGDLTALIPYYANEPGFHWMENGALSYPSYDSVTATLRRIAPTIAESRFEFEELRVVALAPGTASLSMLFRQFFTDTSGFAFDFGGAMTLIAVHRDDSWKFISGHVSEPVQSGR